MMSAQEALNVVDLPGSFKISFAGRFGTDKLSGLSSSDYDAVFVFMNISDILNTVYELLCSSFGHNSPHYSLSVLKKKTPLVYVTLM